MSHFSATVEQPTVVPEAQKLEPYQRYRYAAQLCVFGALVQGGLQREQVVPVGCEVWESRGLSEVAKDWPDGAPFLDEIRALPDGRVEVDPYLQAPQGTPYVWLFECCARGTLREEGLHMLRWLSQRLHLPVRVLFPCQGRVFVAEVPEEASPHQDHQGTLHFDPYSGELDRGICRELGELLRVDYGLQPSHAGPVGPEWWRDYARYLAERVPAIPFVQALDSCGGDPWRLFHEGPSSR